LCGLARRDFVSLPTSAGRRSRGPWRTPTRCRLRPALCLR
jgi:hypothetical protein